MSGFRRPNLPFFFGPNCLGKSAVLMIPCTWQWTMIFGYESVRSTDSTIFPPALLFIDFMNHLKALWGTTGNISIQSGTKFTLAINRVRGLSEMLQNY